VAVGRLVMAAVVIRHRRLVQEKVTGSRGTDSRLPVGVAGVISAVCVGRSCNI